MEKAECGRMCNDANLFLDGLADLLIYFRDSSDRHCIAMQLDTIRVFLKEVDLELSVSIVQDLIKAFEMSSAEDIHTVVYRLFVQMFA